jgi:hypothetical protein
VVRFFADEVDINLVPKVGSQGMPQGEQGEVLTPGTNEKRSLAGARALTTGPLSPWVWYHKPPGRFLDLLDPRHRTPPAPLLTPLAVGVVNAKIPKAQKVQQWLAAQPRVAGLSLPTSCPRANPLERAFGDVPDKGPRNHTRQRLWPLVQEVPPHLRVKGPWRAALSEIYYTPEGTAAVAARHAALSPPGAISQLAA